jgi:hypothetical protein
MTETRPEIESDINYRHADVSSLKTGIGKGRMIILLETSALNS